MKDVINVELPDKNKIVNVVEDVIDNIVQKATDRTTEDAESNSRDDECDGLLRNVVIEIVENIFVNCCDQKDVIEYSQETTGKVTEQQDTDPPKSKTTSKLIPSTPKQSPGYGKALQPSSKVSNFKRGDQNTNNGSQVSPKHVEHCQEPNNRQN